MNNLLASLKFIKNIDRNRSQCIMFILFKKKAVIISMIDRLTSLKFIKNIDRYRSL